MDGNKLNVVKEFCYQFIFAAIWIGGKYCFKEEHKILDLAYIYHRYYMALFQFRHNLCQFIHCFISFAFFSRQIC